MTRVTAVPTLPPRAADSHKGTFGRVLVVAGSKGMSGAAILCGSAALRSGAGLVTVACPPDVVNTVAAGNPCYMTAVIPQTSAGKYEIRAAEELIRLAEDMDALAIGPGLGARPDVAELLRTVLSALPTVPLVLDADALNVFLPGMLANRTVPAVLTPHPGEFARLKAQTVAEVQADREGKAGRYAKRYKVVVALKGHGTVVTDGDKVYVNDTGNPGMATGGSGDVLTGVIAALLAQGLSPFDATALAVWAHGRAGDLVAEKRGPVGLMATDFVEELPKVWGMR
jgi:ADP-dependent NAD(P)H-hydrate dehydratase